MTDVKVRYSPLPQQFADIEALLDEIRVLVKSGDFTLGKPVAEFEQAFAALLGVRHAIGVGSGTDALKLPMKALGIGPGAEVITAANTFIATVGAMDELGARPVFIDCDDNFCMDLDQLEAGIGPNTRAIMPVQLTGDMVDMSRLMKIAERHKLPVVEDACQSLLAEYDGRKAGSWGIAAGFSMHPLKLLNVWGDAGIVVTNDDEMNRKLRLLRNHGLKNRDEVEIMGCNTRLDSLHAIVGKWMVARAEDIAEQRRIRARHYDAGFQSIPQVRIPKRRHNVKHSYLVYVLFAENRDGLLRHCLDRGIEAKVHYPIPLYRQQGLAKFGYKAGDFPVTDRHALETISFPVDQHLSTAQVDYVIETVRNFYAGK